MERSAPLPSSPSPVLLTSAELAANERELLRLKRLGKRFGYGAADPDRGQRDAFDQFDREYAVNEARIVELESLLRVAEVLDADTPTVAVVGLVVDVLYVASGRTASYLLTAAGTPPAGSVSLHSPIGRALLGRRVSDVVEVELPNGAHQTLSITGLRPEPGQAAR